MGYLDKPAAWGWVLRMLAFFAAAAGCGYVYWANADWWAYIQYSPTEMVPKFELPLWVQAVASSVVGLFLAGVGTLLLFLIRQRVRRRRG